MFELNCRDQTRVCADDAPVSDASGVRTLDGWGRAWMLRGAVYGLLLFRGDTGDGLLHEAHFVGCVRSPGLTWKLHRLITTGGHLHH